jgi:hypothetical protein
MSYIILSSRWCDIIVLNVHAPAEDKIYDVKDSFCDELDHMKILLGDFNAKVGQEDIFKPTRTRVYTKLVMIMESCCHISRMQVKIRT